MTTLETLSDSARVWIYQSKTAIPASQTAEIRQHIKDFATRWVSHSNQLKAYGDIYHNQFIVLMVDESIASASGCSIDSSVQFLKQLETHYQLDLFDRMVFTYKDGEEVKAAPREVFAQLYQANKINDATLVFDNLVKNKGEFEKAWLKPLGESWHKRMV
jgi:hypothetical protein